MICTLRKGFALVLITALALNLVACDWKKAERPLTAAGYNFQIGILAASKVVVAVNTYAPSTLDDNSKKNVLTDLKQASDVAHDFAVKVDETTEINPQTKVQLLAEIRRYLDQIDLTIAKLAPDETRVREWLLVLRSTASAFQLVLANTSGNTTPKQLKAKLQDAGEKANRAMAYRSAQDKADLITALGHIASDFAADVAAQKGLDTFALRDLRNKRYNDVQTFISAQLPQPDSVEGLPLKQKWQWAISSRDGEAVYLIRWESAMTGAKGEGSLLLTKEAAEAAVSLANQKNPSIRHFAVKVR